MAVTRNPLDKPENLNQLLKQEQRDYDCTPCRIVGMFYLFLLACMSFH